MTFFSGFLPIRVDLRIVVIVVACTIISVLSDTVPGVILRGCESNRRWKGGCDYLALLFGHLGI